MAYFSINKKTVRRENSLSNTIIFFHSRNMVPSVAEFMYLDKIKWLEMYGVDLHPVKVSDIFKHMLILKVCRITEELCNGSAHCRVSETHW